MNLSLRTSSYWHGPATILATVFAMALADAIMKQTSVGLSLWQIWVLRSSLVIPVLLFIARNALWPNGLRWVLLRSLLLVLMYIGLYAAIPVLDLSMIAAALYTAPLFILVFAAVFLKEQITAKQWTAIACGFIGVLLIVRPLASGFTPLILLPVVAAFLYALSAILTRAKLTETPAATSALWLNLSLLAMGATVSLLIWSGFWPASDYAFLFGHWGAVGLAEWTTIGSLAILMVGISIGFARAYQSPRPQVIATLDYAYLIFASFWGYVFFGEIPDPPTISGMALILASGLIVLIPNKHKNAPSQ